MATRIFWLVRQIPEIENRIDTFKNAGPKGSAFFVFEKHFSRNYTDTVAVIVECAFGFCTITATQSVLYQRNIGLI